MMDENDYALLNEAPRFVCYDCGAAFDRDDAGEIGAHRDEHWQEFVRAQCPINPDLTMLHNALERHGYKRGLMILGARPWPQVSDEEPEVPF